MAHPILWSPHALTDLREIIVEISRDKSLSTALSIVDRIDSAVLKLAGYPLAGHLVPEMPDTAFREISHYPFRIVYRVRESRVEILAVIHGSRLLPRAMGGRERGG